MYAVQKICILSESLSFWFTNETYKVNMLRPVEKMYENENVHSSAAAGTDLYLLATGFYMNGVANVVCIKKISYRHQGFSRMFSFAKNSSLL